MLLKQEDINVIKKLEINTDIKVAVLFLIYAKYGMKQEANGLLNENASSPSVSKCAGFITQICPITELLEVRDIKEEDQMKAFTPFKSILKNNIEIIDLN